MTTSRKFTSIEDFSLNATLDDVVELFDFYLEYLAETNNFPSPKEPKPDCKYQFSAAEAKQELDKWTYNGHPLVSTVGKKHPLVFAIEQKQPLKFVEKKQKFTKRSVMMTEDHWHRLQKLYDMYPTMSKHYVFQALLEDALSRLGV